MTPGRRAAVVVASVALVVGCSSDDDAVEPAEPAPTTAPTAVPDTVATSTTEPAGPDDEPGEENGDENVPVLGDMLDAIEVSARLLPASGAAELVLAIVAADALGDTPVPDDPTQAPARCSPAAVAGAGAGAGAGVGVGADVGVGVGADDDGGIGFVVRVEPPAVDRAEGGLLRFELVSAAIDLADPASSAEGPVPATIRLALDDAPSGLDAAPGPSGDLVSVTAEVLVNGDARTGSFRGELLDGSVVEGAFRCG